MVVGFISLYICIASPSSLLNIASYLDILNHPMSILLTQYGSSSREASTSHPHSHLTENLSDSSKWVCQRQ